MVPPAFTEVRQDVLDGELDNLVKKLPEVENPDIADHKRSKEPIDKMNDVVMVEVGEDVVIGELTVVVVGVHFLGHWLVQGWIKVA